MNIDNKDIVSENKKNKKNKKIKAILITINLVIILLIILFLFWPCFLIEITLFGNKEIIIDYGEKYSEPGFKATLFNKNITKSIVTTNNIKENIGKYSVNYMYKSEYSPFEIEVERKVIRKDVSSPELTLNGEKNVEVTINTEYKELGCKATDNLDGDLTEKVTISGNVDVKKLGEYIVSYQVTDSNGNNATTTRKVKVERVRPTQMSVKDFTLDGWYDEVKLKKTKNMGEEYYKSVIIAGDSNIMNLYLSGNAYPKQAWAVPSLHAEGMFSRKINIYGTSESMLLLDAVKKYKPKKMLLSFGTFSSSRITEESFLKNANAIIQKIKELSPETNLGLISIYPFDKKLEGKKLKQEVINKYNFYLLEMAHKYNLKFLDVSSALKGKDGYLYWQYAYVDGWHLTNEGHNFVKEYIKTHAMED